MWKLSWRVREIERAKRNPSIKFVLRPKWMLKVLSLLFVLSIVKDFSSEILWIKFGGWENFPLNTRETVLIVVKGRKSCLKVCQTSFTWFIGLKYSFWVFLYWLPFPFCKILHFFFLRFIILTVYVLNLSLPKDIYFSILSFWKLSTLPQYFFQL